MTTTHQAMKSDTDQTSRNEAATRRWIEEVGNRRNAAVVDELLSPDFEAHSLFHNPYRPSWLRAGSSIERQKKTIERDVMGLENRHTTIDQMIATEDMVITVATTTGTRQGKPVSYTGISITRFADGKIVEGWGLWDRLGLYQQLGVVAETPDLMKQAGLET